MVSLQGRIDHTVAESFKEQLMQVLQGCCYNDSKVVIDMEQVDYMSSVGLRVLLIAAKHCQSDGGEVIVAGLHSTMQEIFEISRFDKIFKTFDTTLTAVEYFDREAAVSYAAAS